MHKLIIPILMIAVLAACTGTKSDVTAVLERADSIMESCPDSAYTLLNNIDSVTVSNLSRAESARYYLLLGTAMNKTDRPMAFDSLFQHAVVDYYDRHGTANEQMRARYIMGSICRDQHEAPRAIEWYLSATDRADTLASDCDYLTLMRIYGQMAEVYRHQLMPMEEIESNRWYSKYAAKCGNTYEYIRGIELQVIAYSQLKDTVKVLAITDSVYCLYMNNDMIKEAASVYPTAIYINLLNHNYVKAKRLMDIFEHQSGLFDGNGEIKKGREHYYLSKGLYYHGTNRLDSAEYFYRKLIDAGYNLDGYRGLFSLSLSGYTRDSLANYAQKYENCLACTESDINIESMRNVEGLYNYSRQQRLALERQKRIEHQNNIIWFITTLFIILLATMIYYRKYLKNMIYKINIDWGLKMSEVSDKYENKLEQLSKTKEKEIEIINNTYTEKMNSLSKEYKSKLDTIVDRYTRKEQSLLKTNRKLMGEIMPRDSALSHSLLMQSEAVKEVMSAVGSSHIVTLHNITWQNLENEVRKNFPGFYNTMVTSTLNEFETKVCMLILLKISVKNCSYITGHTEEYISHVRSNIAYKLNIKATRKELDRRIIDMATNPSLHADE